MGRREQQTTTTAREYSRARCQPRRSWGSPLTSSRCRDRRGGRPGGRSAPASPDVPAGVRLAGLPCGPRRPVTALWGVVDRLQTLASPPASPVQRLSLSDTPAAAEEGAPEPEPGQRCTGHVKWFNSTKGAARAGAGEEGGGGGRRRRGRALTGRRPCHIPTPQAMASSPRRSATTRCLSTRCASGGSSGSAAASGRHACAMRHVRGRRPRGRRPWPPPPRRRAT